MAKCVITLEDDVKDGNPVIRGNFDVIDGPTEEDGLGIPPKFTPSQLMTSCLQKLWDAGVLNAHIPAYCRDMMNHNREVGNMQRQAAEAAQKAEAAAALERVVGKAANADDLRLTSENRDA